MKTLCTWFTILGLSCAVIGCGGDGGGAKPGVKSVNPADAVKGAADATKGAADATKDAAGAVKDAVTPAGDKKEGDAPAEKKDGDKKEGDAPKEEGK